MTSRLPSLLRADERRRPPVLTLHAQVFPPALRFFLSPPNSPSASPVCACFLCITPVPSSAELPHPVFLSLPPSFSLSVRSASLKPAA